MAFCPPLPLTSCHGTEWQRANGRLPLTTYGSPPYGRAMLDRIITDLGGDAAVAKAIGVSDYSTVASWRRRGSIPVRYWSPLIRLAGKLGVDLTAEALLDAHRPVDAGR